MGASTRLQQIEAERQAIFAAFPELRRGPASALAGPAPARRGRGGSRKGRTLSAQARKRMSAGMRRYWAKRKAAQKSGPAKAAPKGGGPKSS